MSDAFAFWDMTPREIEGRFTAHASQTQQKAEEADRLAWLIGNYVRTTEFPDKPNMIKKQDEIDEEEMPAEDMKGRLMLFADIHNTIEEVG